MLIVWDVEAGKALYGTPNRDPVTQIKFFNNDEDKMIAVLDKGVQILTVDKINKKVRSHFLSPSASRPSSIYVHHKSPTR